MPESLKPVSVSLPIRDFEVWLLMVFRYCLGRRTYVTSDCEEWLRTYWHLLPVGYKKQIHGDIKDAIENGRAGDSCDVMSWRKVLELDIVE